MSDKEVDVVKLVLESGEVFMFHEGIVSAKKRDKAKDKEEQKEVKGGIDVTDVIKHCKDKKGRWMTIAQSDFKHCKFICKQSTGRLYECVHCEHAISRRGKSKLFLV